MNEPTVPSELIPATMSFWEAQRRTAAALLDEVGGPYVSKARAVTIAKVALAQLLAMVDYATAVEAADAAKPQSDLILPQSGLILP